MTTLIRRGRTASSDGKLGCAVVNATSAITVAGAIHTSMRQHALPKAQRFGIEGKRSVELLFLILINYAKGQAKSLGDSISAGGFRICVGLFSHIDIIVFYCFQLGISLRWALPSLRPYSVYSSRLSFLVKRLRRASASWSAFLRRDPTVGLMPVRRVVL
jgi:hypothetical protein